VNAVDRAPTRTLADILRANVLTRFNAILGALLVVIAFVGPVQDGLFGVILVLNASIGIVQEWRAKRVLDRLTLAVAPLTRVLRAGSWREIPGAEIVLDDVVAVGSGEQVPADCVLLEGDVEVDESLLSGESDPVSRAKGDELLAGSLVTAGAAVARASRVGEAAYAQRLTREARQFRLARSQLRTGIDTILRLVTWAIVPTAVLLVISQLGHTDLRDALRGSVAGVGSMVPEGLVLLTSMAFAVAVIRLGRHQVLIQELAAVEGLSRVDVVCLDKTGTLTTGDMEVQETVPLEEGQPVAEAFGALAAADPEPNATVLALRRSFPAPDDWSPAWQVPFSSSRQWSAVDFGPRGTWLMGAPDVLLPLMATTLPGDQVNARIGAGLRVLLLARAASTAGPQPDLAEHSVPCALLALEERIRPDAPATLAYFEQQGVAIKVISGDHPRTVAAIAGRAGLRGADHAVDGRDLPQDLPSLQRRIEESSVFGRVMPDQKRTIVASLKAAGHTVAMTGDGVNDVLALKDADLGVAMGSGTPAARSVAKVVLLDNRFAALPEVVAEGRRIIGNVDRVANLFVTKTVYAMLLALMVGFSRIPFPFLPRHLTVVSTLTIGIPGFFLALAPNTARPKLGFVGRVLRFAVPAGTVAATATFLGYQLARHQPGTPLIDARTTATVVLFIVATWVLSILARPLTGPRLSLVAGMAACFSLVLALPVTRRFYGFHRPAWIVLLAGVGVASLAIAILESGWRLAGLVGGRIGSSDRSPWPRREHHPPASDSER
jgi:cation-transporting P-type ATPase E